MDKIDENKFFKDILEKDDLADEHFNQQQFRDEFDIDMPDDEIILLEPHPFLDENVDYTDPVNKLFVDDICQPYYWKVRTYDQEQYHPNEMAPKYAYVAMHKNIFFRAGRKYSKMCFKIHRKQSDRSLHNKCVQAEVHKKRLQKTNVDENNKEYEKLLNIIKSLEEKLDNMSVADRKKANEKNGVQVSDRVLNNKKKELEIVIRKINRNKKSLEFVNSNTHLFDPKDQTVPMSKSIENGSDDEYVYED